MSSLIGKFVPGYNTFWMAVGMIVPTFILLVIAAYRAWRGERLDVATCVLAGLVILITSLSQYNVARVKAVRRSPQDEQPARFTHLASEMRIWVIAALIVGLLILTLAVIFWFKHNQRYNISWGMLLASCSVSMFGVAIDYEEWRQITLLRSLGSAETFRFSAFTHYSLSTATVLLFLTGAVGLIWTYASRR